MCHKHASMQHIYVYIYVYVYIYSYICTCHKQAYVQHIYIFICMYAYILTYMHVSQASMHACMSCCMYVFNNSVQTYLIIRIHTRMHSLTSSSGYIRGFTLSPHHQDTYVDSLSHLIIRIHTWIHSFHQFEHAIGISHRIICICTRGLRGGYATVCLYVCMYVCILRMYV